MSQLYLATDADDLAARLFEEIAAHRKVADPFEPISIVVPNRFVQQWLRFRIAREWGVAINLQFTFLEQAVWDWLREIDPRPHEQPPELLDEERYHLLVLSILWNDADPALAPLQAFFEKGTRTISRLGCRRAWQLAGRLGSLIRDYEYHRQESIVHRWLEANADVDVPAAWREREAAQRAVFRAVTNEVAGRRAVLNGALKRNFKTLPQYVMELVLEVKDFREPPPRLIHLFGLAQISPLHHRALALLGTFHDWRIYHLNPLVSRLGSVPHRPALRALAQAYRGEERPDDRPGTELLQIWGRAGAESLGLTADFVRDSRVRPMLLKRAKAPLESATVLQRLQSLILGEEANTSPRVPQDVSLQIVRCPGIWREVETIHAGIVNALQNDPTLRQTDIAVLVADMNLYRPALAAVFERPPARLSFALADYSAARVSTFGQAVVGMLDLALESLSRTRVFEVLLNPCVLARLKIDRESALHWLTWAEHLGIYRGWDSSEKKEQGYVASPLYSWKLGLQRLRLGQFMNVASEDARGPLAQWQGVIPFADIESGDRDRLDQFCRVVEGLLPMLVRLRGMKATAREWSDAILALMQRFLAPPDDRPEEEPVRDALIQSLRRLGEWDVLHEASAAPLPLALVREFVASRLQTISGHRSEFLSSGVTIAGLLPQRPIPFEVIFLAGMGERHFPGAAALSPFDLRQIHRQDGDILPVEQNRFAFLEAILSARQKLVITYDARDLQKDEDLQPAIPVAQLQRFVSKSILANGEFQPVTAPLLAHDPAYIDESKLPPYQDVLMCENVADRVLALDVLERTRGLELSPRHRADLARMRERLTPTFTIPAPTIIEARPTPTVSLGKLRKFLENPAAAALRYHLRANDEWDEGRDEDFEPLTSPKYVGNRLVKQTLQRIVQRAETESVADLAANWPEEFARKYEEWMRRCQLPEGAFGEVDAEVLRAQVEAGLNEGGVLAFLAKQAGKPWCGPYLIGESETPVGARRRLDALVVPLSRALPGYADGVARIVGAWPFAWRDDVSLDLLVFHYGDFNRKKPLGRSLFEPLLFATTLAAAGKLGGLTVTLHLACPNEIVSVPLDGDLVQKDAARAYLSQLATDFLDVRLAEQIPFDILQKDWSGVYLEEKGADHDAALVEDWRWQEDNEGWGQYAGQVNELMSLGFRVPSDVGAKARRRLRPLFLMLRPLEPTPAKKPARKSKKGASG